MKKLLSVCFGLVMAFTFLFVSACASAGSAQGHKVPWLLIPNDELGNEPAKVVLLEVDEDRVSQWEDAVASSMVLAPLQGNNAVFPKNDGRVIVFSQGGLIYSAYPCTNPPAMVSEGYCEDGRFVNTEEVNRLSSASPRHACHSDPMGKSVCGQLYALVSNAQFISKVTIKSSTAQLKATSVTQTTDD